MSDTAPLVTADELERFPRDDRRYELVRGRVVPMSPVSFEHGRVVANMLFLLTGHVRRHNLGVAVTEVGVQLASGPDTVRAPDVAFIRRERVPSRDTREFLNGPPDVAAEVLSPGDRPSEIRERIDEYLGHGVALVLVIDPEKRTVTTHRASTGPTTLSVDDDVMDLSDVIPHFRCTVRQIFE